MDEIVSETTHFTNTSSDTACRWDQINLGLFLTIATCLFKDNVSMRSKLVLVVVLKMMVSFGDSTSDFFVAFSLFHNGLWTWAVVVLVIDYIPGWQVLLSNVTLNYWKDVGNRKERLITIFISLLAPISTPLFQLRWLLNFDSKNNRMFDYNHFNARLSELISVAFESPVQMVLILVMYTKGKLALPWEGDSEITDSEGNVLHLGPVPGLFSLLMSIISIVKGSIEVSEALSTREKVVISTYAFSTAMFRIISYTFLIIYFKEWSIGIFVVIIIATIIVILRFDKSKRKDFSLSTTVIMSMFAPCAISKYPHRKQLKSNDNKKAENAKSRNMLAGEITLVTIPIIIIFDGLLLLIFLYVPDFKTSGDILISKDLATTVISLFLLPIGLFSYVAGFSMRVGKLRKRHYFGPILSVLTLLICTISLITLNWFGINPLSTPNVVSNGLIAANTSFSAQPQSTIIALSTASVLTLPVLECCERIQLRGNSKSAIKHHGTKFGWYSREKSGANQMVNNRPVYKLENSTNLYSIVYGPKRGWKVFDGVPLKPDTAGSGEIKFSCKNAKCPTDCSAKRFQFWDTSNPANKKFTSDPSIELSCGHVDGYWSIWEHWSSCSKTCNFGNQYRYRYCNSPAPSYQGNDCSGGTSHYRNNGIEQQQKIKRDEQHKTCNKNTNCAGCCETVQLQGGKEQVIRYHGAKFGMYRRRYSGPNQFRNDHPVYIHENTKEVYSIVYGPRRGWKVFRGIPQTPDSAGSGEIKFDCNNATCPADCMASKFQFWDTTNPRNKRFILDPSITLACALSIDVLLY